MNHKYRKRVNLELLIIILLISFFVSVTAVVVRGGTAVPQNEGHPESIAMNVSSEVEDGTSAKRGESLVSGEVQVRTIQIEGTEVILAERKPVEQANIIQEEVFLDEFAITELKSCIELPENLEIALNLAVELRGSSKITPDAAISNSFSALPFPYPNISIESGNPCFVWENGYDGNTGQYEAEWYRDNPPSGMNINVVSNDGIAGMYLDETTYAIGMTDEYYFIIMDVYKDSANNGFAYQINMINVLELIGALEKSDSLYLMATSANGAMSASVFFEWTVLDSHMQFDKESYNVEIPNVGDTTIETYPVVSADADVVPSNQPIVFSLEQTYSGVTIDSQTGKITAMTGAAAGTVKLKAVCGKFCAKAELVITVKDVVPVRMSFLKSKYGAIIPESDVRTIVATATLLNAAGEILESVGVSYTLGIPYPGVSVDSATGNITIAPDTQVGVVALTATCGDFSASASIEFFESGNTQVIDLDVVEGETYFVTVSASGLTGDAEINAAVFYSAEALHLSSSAAQVDGWDTQTGNISRTNLTISNCISGELRFSFSKVIPEEKAWSGVVTVLQFSALETGSVEIRVYEDSQTQKNVPSNSLLIETD